MDKKDKSLVQVVELDLDLKVVKCHYTEDFLREVSQIYSNKKVFTEVNVEILNIFENGTEVTAELLKSTGAIAKIEKDGVKILGEGNLEKSYNSSSC